MAQIIDRIDVNVFKNTNTIIRGQIFNSDGSVYPIPAATFKLTAKYRSWDADNDAVLIKSSAAGDFLILDSDAGQFQVELVPSDLTNVPKGSYSYDIQLSQSDGKKFAVQRGTMIVLDGVTAS